MSRRILLPLIFALAAAGAADAQFGGGYGGGGYGGGGGGGGGYGGGMGGHRGGGRQQQEDPEPPPAAPQPDIPSPARRLEALSKVQITGVITRIDPAGGRVTIAYDEVDALNWSPGTTSFEVEKPSLLAGLAVGEKVRFHLESQQIASISPIGPSASPDTQ